MFVTIVKTTSYTMGIARNLFVRSISSNNLKKQDLLTKNKTDQELLTNRNIKQSTKRSLSTVNHDDDFKKESLEFMLVFPDLVRDLMDKANLHDESDASKWFVKALQYNVPNGKKSRGLATVYTYKTLVGQDQLSPENLRRIYYLGWCVEMLQSACLIFDDMMDGSTTRRGKPCWYKNEEVGLIAFNDCVMIENAIYYILKKEFIKNDYYIELVDLFHEALFIATIGQSLETHTSNKDVSTFTMNRYKLIVENKTTFYSFYLPVALAMRMAGYTDPEVFRQTKAILVEMGYFFQVQDDFLDCFGNPEVTGKIGTDIQENKCTWLSVLCMQRATREQKEIMRDCYGKSDPVKTKRVVELYEELGLPHTYKLYEEESHNLIKTNIEQASRGVPNKIFFHIMDKIYRRNS